MSWFAVDDRFHSHRKVLSMRRSPAYADALAVWTLSGSWCAGQLHENLTGQVPVDVVASFGITGWQDGLDLLVKVGLWEVLPDGDTVQFHDWEMWNGPGGKANRSREQTQLRVHRYRLGVCEGGEHSKDCPTTDMDGHPRTCPARAAKKRVTPRNATPGRDGSGRVGSGTSTTELRLEEKQDRDEEDSW
jgi:hypothetical protein